MLILAYTLGIYSQSKSNPVNWLHFLTVLATRQMNVPLIGFCHQYKVFFTVDKLVNALIVQESFFTAPSSPFCTFEFLFEEHAQLVFV